MHRRRNLTLIALPLCIQILGGCAAECVDSEPGTLVTRAVVGKYTRVWDLVVAEDAGAVIVGSTDATPGLDSDYVLDAFVLKVDPSGQIQWKRSWNWAEEEEWTCISVSDDGGYYLAGVSGGTVVLPGYILTSTDLILAKIDVDGNEVWSKRLQTGHNVQVWSLCEGADRCLVVAGSEGQFDLLAKFDSDGNELWRKRLDNSVWFDVISTGDGGFAMTGRTTGGQLSMAKTDGEGVVQWQFDGADTPLFRSVLTSGQELVETGDGGFAAVGTDLNEATAEFRPYIAKLDANGTFLWGTFGQGSPNAYAYGLVETLDGSLVAGGYAYSNAPIFEQFSVCERFYAVRFSESGAVQWFARLGDFEAPAYCIQLNSLGQVAFAGTEYDGDDVIYLLTSDVGG